MEVADRETIAALMAVPIVLGSRVEGIIYVGNQHGAPRSPRATRASVQRLADHAGVAIQNARQFRGHVRRQEELAVLYEVTRAVTGPLPRRGGEAALHPLLGRLLDARHLLALGWSEERRAFSLVWASGPGWAPDDDRGSRRVVLSTQQPRDRTTDYLATCGRRAWRRPLRPGLRYARRADACSAIARSGCSRCGARPRYSRADEELVTTVAALSALRLR